MIKHTLRNTNIIIIIAAVISALMLYSVTETEYDTRDTERAAGFLPAAGIISGAGVQTAAALISRRRDRKKRNYCSLKIFGLRQQP